MNSLTIKVDVIPGTGIEQALEQSSRLAALMGLAYVNFNFNGTEWRAFHDFTAEATDPNSKYFRVAATWKLYEGVVKNTDTWTPDDEQQTPGTS